MNSRTMTVALALTSAVLAAFAGQAASAGAPPTRQVPGMQKGPKWQGLPMKCDGSQQTVHFLTAKGATLTLVLQMSSPTATALTIVSSSQEHNGKTIKGRSGSQSLQLPGGAQKNAPAGSTAMLGGGGKPPTNVTQASSSFMATLQASLSGTAFQIAINDGSYEFNCADAYPQSCDQERYSAPATTVCQ